MALFEKKKPPEPASFALELPAVDNGTTHLGRNLSIKGKISGQDRIQMHGNFEGEVDLESELSIEPTAHVRGQLKAKTYRIGGDFDGDLTAVETVEVHNTAIVRGNLITPVISVREGAVFEGNVKMNGFKPDK